MGSRVLARLPMPDGRPPVCKGSALICRMLSCSSAALAGNAEDTPEDANLLEQALCAKNRSGWEV